MKYLIFALAISTAAFARDPYGFDDVRSITFDDNSKEMVVKLMDDETKTYTVSSDSRTGKCLKDAYKGQVKVKIHYSDDEDSIKNCSMQPRGQEVLLVGGRPI